MSLDPLAELKRLYFETTRTSIDRDLMRAIALFKSLPSEAERERAAVYMDGLAEMRTEWGSRPKGPDRGRGAKKL